jgi:ABC-type glutathione transport system ATPase component
LKHQVLALVQWIRDRRNIGIVFITHDLRVAAQICDTIIVMQNGALKQLLLKKFCCMLLDDSYFPGFSRAAA